MKFIVLAGFNWDMVLSIVLFFVALGVLVTIHELGHFIAAKSFNVYCSDFSIGFGPKIVKIKRKKGETKFSIGLLPLGGYVSMAGEEDNNGEGNDGQKVPISRSLVGIARWKRIIIMAAGIVMNFVLAYIIFFICVSCFPQVQVNPFYSVNKEISSQYINVEDTNVGFDQNDQLALKWFTYNPDKESTWEVYDPNKHTSNDAIIRIINKGTLVTTSNPQKEYVATLSYNFAKGVNNTDITRNIYLYEADKNTSIDGYYMPLIKDGEEFLYKHNEGDIFNVEFYYYNALDNNEVTDLNAIINYEKEEGNTEKNKVYKGTLKLESNGTKFNEVGVSFHKITYRNGWGSFEKAGSLWVESTTLIAQALGGLFIGQGWHNLNGPLAIFTETTSILQNNPFYFYLQTWGSISVNLALFNLLPFPGLDGWQICVEIVEGSVNGIKKARFKASKKKAKQNAKPIETVVSSNEIENVKVSETAPIEINENAVTATKNANLVIGEETNLDGYKDWQIPPKVKAIMSYIGLGLIFALMIFVLIKDIFMLF